MPRITTAERFWATVERSEGCWLWTGRLDAKGYGRVGFRSKPNQRAHRVAWLLTNGEIPQDNVVMHFCDNPACCNPAHLSLGTQADNIADRHKKGRTVNPPSRAKLTDAQVRSVREMYASGEFTQQELADRFGVSRGNLSNVLNRRLYAHVR